MINTYLKFSPFYFFCLYGIIFIFFTFCTNYILYDDLLYYKSFEDILTVNRITQLIEQQRFFQRIGYWIIPLILLLRAFYTTVCLAAGAVITEQQLKFRQCFNISMKADVIFLFELIVKINGGVLQSMLIQTNPKLM